MKAWTCHNGETDFSTVVYAETRGEAKAFALHSAAMVGHSFDEITVLRCPEMDALYKGSSEANWYDDDVRITLVKELDWHCIEPDIEECRDCAAFEWCETGQEYMND